MTTTPTTEVAEVADVPEVPDIVAAATAGKCATLVAAVTAAELLETLKGKGPFTVFAPSDEAFAKLPKGALAELLKPENKGKLKNLLKYHVVAGRLMAAEVALLNAARSVEGRNLTIRTKSGKLRVDGAVITKADIAASNGVIHVIDAVLQPGIGSKTTH